MSFTNQTLSILGTAAGIATATDQISKQKERSSQAFEISISLSRF